MVLNDPQPAIVAGFALAHMAIVIAQAGEPLDPVGKRVAAEAALVRGGHLLEDKEEELFRCGRTVELLRGFEQIEGDSIARGREEIVGALGKAVELEGASARLRLPPGVEQTSFFEMLALLLHAHVRHLQAFSQFADGQALAALEFIEDLQAGTSGDSLEKALLQGNLGG
jgi:hypothetical protein